MAFINTLIKIFEITGLLMIEIYSDHISNIPSSQSPEEPAYLSLLRDNEHPVSYRAYIEITQALVRDI